MDKTRISKIWRRVSWDKLVAYPKNFSELFLRYRAVIFTESTLKIETGNIGLKADKIEKLYRAGSFFSFNYK